MSRRSRSTTSRVRLALEPRRRQAGALIDAVYLGEVGSLPGSLVPPGMLGTTQSIGPIAHDPAKARALLAEAGLPTASPTTLWAMPVVRAYMPNARRAAELIQADWAAIGVKAEIVTYDWAQYLEASKQGKHEAVILGLDYDYPDPGSVIIWGWSCNSAKIGFNRVTLVQQGIRRRDPGGRADGRRGERDRLYKQAEAIFNEEVPAMLTAYARFVAFTRPEVEDYGSRRSEGSRSLAVGLKD